MYPVFVVWSVTDDRSPTPRVYPTKRAAVTDALGIPLARHPRVTRHGLTPGDRVATPVEVQRICDAPGGMLGRCTRLVHSPKTSHSNTSGAWE